MHPVGSGSSSRTSHQDTGYYFGSSWLCIYVQGLKLREGGEGGTRQNCKEAPLILSFIAFLCDNFQNFPILISLRSRVEVRWLGGGHPPPPPWTCVVPQLNVFSICPRSKMTTTNNQIELSRLWCYVSYIF